MKILYFTDTHDMGRNPGARIDDYHTSIMLKFREVVEVAIANNVDAVVHGGDWWHYPRVANSIYNQHQRLLRRLRRKKIKVFVVPGNHDLYGYSLTTIDQTSIGTLADAGLVTLLTRDKSYTISDGHTSIEIHGREYSVDIDEDPLTDYQIVENPNADFNFLFAHGMLLDKPFHPDVKHTLTKDVVTDADLVMTGHYHTGYPLHVIGDTEFGNCGSTGRDEGSVENTTRIPQYSIIDAEHNNGYDVEYIEYVVAQKGVDIFDRTQLVSNKQHVRHLEAFHQTVNDALAFDEFDPKDILAKTTGLSKKLLNDAMTAIVEQEKIVQDGKLDGFIAKKAAIGIAYVEAENFQSHKKTRVDFNEKGLNAITGATDSGKSAIIRIIRWVCYNDPKGTEFIRHGSSRTTGTVGFTDGSSITRSRTRSSAGEYIVRDTKGNETELKGFGTTLPIEITNTHQMPKVELSTGVERSLNFSHQLEGHFLLSESPATRASAIGRLTGVHVVDAAVKEKAKDIRKITIDTNSSEKRISELDEQIATFATLAEEERKINVIHGLMMATDKLEKKTDLLEEAYEDYITHTDRSRELRTELRSYADVDKGVLSVQLAEEKLKEIAMLETLLKDSRRFRKESTSLKAELVMFEHLDEGIEAIAKAESLQDEIKRLEQMSSEVKRAQVVEDITTHKLTKYKDMSSIKDLSHLDDLATEIKQLSMLALTYDSENLVCEDFTQRVKKQADNTYIIEDDIRKLVKAMGSKCPLCSQDITGANVEEMLAHV